MHQRTIRALTQLEEADWFSCVGKQDADTVIVLSSWDEAMQECASAESEWLNLEAANQYRARLMERSKSRLIEWNTIVAEMKPFIESMANRKIEAVVRANNLPKIFGDTVRWHLLHLCMESEYADVYPPGFFASRAYWYTRGHFPCGYRGKFPNEGKTVLY
jgi:hypothetical protein